MPPTPLMMLSKDLVLVLPWDVTEVTLLSFILSDSPTEEPSLAPEQTCGILGAQQASFSMERLHVFQTSQFQRIAHETRYSSLYLLPMY